MSEGIVVTIWGTWISDNPGMMIVEQQWSECLSN